MHSQSTEAHLCACCSGCSHRSDCHPWPVQAVALAVEPPSAVRPPCGKLRQVLQLRRGAEAGAHRALAAGRHLPRRGRVMLSESA